MKEKQKSKQKRKKQNGIVTLKVDEVNKNFEKSTD